MDIYFFSILEIKVPAVTVITNKNSTISYEVDIFPDYCPNCFRGINPKFLFGFNNEDSGYLHLTFMCPILSCNKDFIGNYNDIYQGIYSLQKLLLGRMETKVFSEAIINLSPDFNIIYAQGEIAEDSDLTEICGVGYRKALEFLIKDYIISKKPDKKEDVEKLMLGKCINEHIENQKLKDIAKRATWLGNDETHYVRKWQGKNITDLKLLLSEINNKNKGGL